jgi:hypothetical protein
MKAARAVGIWHWLGGIEANGRSVENIAPEEAAYHA